MRSDLILVTWAQLKSEWVVGKKVSIINSYSPLHRSSAGLVWHTGICSRIAIRGHSSHIIDVYVTNEEGLVRSMDIEERLYDEASAYIMIYIAPEDLVALDISNKSLLKCWKCSCPTEMRRDFADMTVREFCPRCKI